MPTVKCDHCGAPLQRHPCRIKAAKHLFCSKRCAAAWKATHLRRPRVTLVCDHCGTSFERRLTEARKYRHHFCSSRCRSAWQALHLTKDKVPVNCAYCGEILLCTKPEATRHKRHFCGLRCHAEWRSENTTGPGNPNWLGGPISYYGPNWQRQAARARKRDCFRCKVCCATQDHIGKRHDVHHIIPFREFGYIAGQNDFYRDANELSNLITLCPGCHTQADFGKLSAGSLRSLIL